jgi:hypothetical protein
MWNLIFRTRILVALGSIALDHYRVYSRAPHSRGAGQNQNQQGRVSSYRGGQSTSVCVDVANST